MSSDLLAAIRADPSDETAWTEWFKSSHTKVYYAVFQLTHGDKDLSDEITQSAFVRFLRYRGFERVMTEEEAIAYVIQTAKHVFYDYHRVKKDHVSLEEIMTYAAAPEDELEPLRQEIRQVAQSLNKEDRELLNLAFEGYTLSEIAKQFNVSYSNAGVRLHRIKKYLSEKITKKL